MRKYNSVMWMGAILIITFLVIKMSIYYYDVKEEKKQREMREIIELDISNKLDAYFTELENPENTHIDSCIVIRQELLDALLDNMNIIDTSRFHYFFDELVRADGIFLKTKKQMIK